MEEEQERKREDRRNDSAYHEWRKKVYERDFFKCKLSSDECNGKISAHHILGWTLFPEHRYNIENGITLCHIFLGI